MARTVSLLVTVVLLALPACAKSGDDAAPVQPAAGAVTVEVTNDYALPMEIYAAGSGITHRLGTVHPGMSGTFVLPPNLVGGGSVTLEASPTGEGESFRSGEVLLAPGTVVDLAIGARPFNSTVTLRQ